MSARRETACFVHIPKTGGTSACGMAKRIYARGRYLHLEGADESEAASTARLQIAGASVAGSFITTHLTLAWCQEQLPDALRFCLIRDPLQRLESQYLHMFRAGRVASFEDFEARFGHAASNLQTRYLSNQRFAAGVRDAAGCQPLGMPDLQQALHNLQHAIHLVGVLEQYNEFVWQLGQRLAWPWYALLQRPSNQRSKSLDHQRLNHEQRQRAIAANAYDQLLYEKALVIVAQRRAASGKPWGPRLLEQGSTAYARIAPVTSPIARRLLRLAGRSV